MELNKERVRYCNSLVAERHPYSPIYSKYKGNLWTNTALAWLIRVTIEMSRSVEVAANSLPADSPTTCSPTTGGAPATKDVRYNVNDRYNYLREKC